jgi:2'-5' RNA ligase
MFSEVRDHWYWRPGWRVGRSFYTWHLTFADHPEAAELLAAYQPVLEAMPGITPVPLEWLHLTMQGVGFSDKVSADELAEIVEAARYRLARIAPFTVTIGPAVVDPETVQLPVRPIQPLQNLRDHVRAAIADVWGPDSVPEHPELRPHISLGYFNSPAPAAPLRAHLSTIPPHTATLTVSSISLINLHRDNQMYEWTPATTVKLPTA